MTALTPAPVEKLSYRVDDVVPATGMSRTRVYDEIAAGRLKARKLGADTLVLRTDLLAFLEALPAMEAKRA